MSPEVLFLLLAMPSRYQSVPIRMLRDDSATSRERWAEFRVEVFLLCCESCSTTRVALTMPAWRARRTLALARVARFRVPSDSC